MTRLGFWKRFAVGLLVLTGALAVVAAILVTTEAGRIALIRIAARIASAPERQIALAGLASPDLGTLSAESVLIGDNDGTWLHAESVAIRWSPHRLLFGVLDVEALRLDRIGIARRPIPSQGAALPSLPKPLLWLDLGTVTVARLDIAAPVFGVADAFSLVGRARFLPEDLGPVIDGAVEVERLADAAASLRMTWSYSAATDVLAIDARLREPENGTLQRFAGMRPNLPFTASFAGSGILMDWRGAVTLDAGAGGKASGTATIRRDRSGARITASADADLARAFADARAELFAGRPHLDLALFLAANGAMSIDTLKLESPVASLAANGSVDADRTAWTARFTATMPTSDPLRALIGTPVAFRDLIVEGDLAGLAAEAGGRATLTVSDAEFADLAADRIEATLTPHDGGRFRIDAEANGVRIAERDAGRPLRITLDARYTDQALSLAAADMTLGPARVHFDGEARHDRIAGKATLAVPDLGDFAGLSGIPLSGAINLDADITGNPAERNATLALRGAGNKVTLGVAPLDRLLATAFEISGGVRLRAGTLALDNIVVDLPGVSLRASGTLGGGRTEGLTADLRLDDIARLDDRLSGAATATAVATGDPWAPEVAVTARVPAGTAFGRPAEGVSLRYAGRIPGGALSGSVVFDGRIAGLPIAATARVAGRPATLDISELSMRVASVTVTGALALQPGTLPAGTLTVSAPRLAELAPLVGAPTAGALNGTIALPAAGTDAVPRVEASIANLQIGEAVSVARLAVTAEDFDTAARRVAGSVTGSNIRIGGLAVDTVSGRITGDPAGLGLDLDMTLLDGAAHFAGDLRRVPDGAVLALRALSATRHGETVRLAAPAELTIAAGRVSFTDLTIVGASGRAEITGSIGGTVDLRARADGLPLSVVGLFAPRFALAGRIDGSANLSGPYSDLAGTYDVRVRNLSFGELRRVGIDALDIVAAGRVSGGRATAQGRLSGPGGAALSFDGTVPLDTTGTIALDVGGSLDAGDLNRAFRIARGEVSGRLSVDGRLGGPLARPGFAGTIGLSGGRYTDRAAGIDFDNITGTATANGRLLSIRSLAATAANGGKVTASGTVNLAAAAGPVADINATAENARVIASGAATLDVSGSVRLQGPLTGLPAISGRLTVERLDVQLANRLPQRVAALEVKHRNAPRNLQRIVGDRARRSAGGETGNFDARLDLAVSAPGRIFIRGQGLDAELEGDIALRGTIAAPATQGAFRLRRGSISVLAQRFDLTSATLTFAGDIDPALNIVSRTRAADITAVFTVTGTASAPEFHITSEPPMAEDEILSRLLFDKASADLTAGEALALAQAAGQLAGFSTGPDFLDTLRRKTGLDRLTVSTDAAGNPVVDAGRYVTDRAYLGIRQGADSQSTRATVDIDITRELKAHGEIGADGRSKFGVTIEHEY